MAQCSYEHTGIALSDNKQNLVYSRLSRRLRELGLASFRDYRKYLESEHGKQEIEHFINAISTNLTKFFREAHHFEHFRAHVATPIAKRGETSNRRIRIWSAGCSSGEEPYSIAIVLKREVPDIASHDVRILATDIDTAILDKAASGIYPASAIEDVPSAYRKLLAPKGGRQASENLVSDNLTISSDIRSLIVFRHLNLMDPWPFHGQFDAIFCRNVMIYFDGPTKAKLVDRFMAQLKPGGWLYIGHSESLLGSHPGLQLVGRTTYRRLA